MTESTRLGSLFETSKSIDILLYVRCNPLCKKTDVYRNVSRNVHIPEKIGEMVEIGLIAFSCVAGSNATHMSLTEKGIRLTDLLLEAESLLDETHNTQS